MSHLPSIRITGAGHDVSVELDGEQLRGCVAVAVMIAAADQGEHPLVQLTIAPGVLEVDLPAVVVEALRRQEAPSPAAPIALYSAKRPDVAQLAEAYAALSDAVRYSMLRTLGIAAADEVAAALESEDVAAILDSQVLHRAEALGRIPALRDAITGAHMDLLDEAAKREAMPQDEPMAERRQLSAARTVPTDSEGAE